MSGDAFNPVRAVLRIRDALKEVIDYDLEAEIADCDALLEWLALGAGLEPVERRQPLTPAERSARYRTRHRVTKAVTERHEKRHGAVTENVTAEPPAPPSRASESSSEISEESSALRSLSNLPEEEKETARERHGDRHEKRDAERDAERDAVKAVFEHWLAVTKRDATKVLLTADRRSKIVARLRDGYTVEQLKQSIDGCARSAFHSGENDRGQRYDDLTTTLKSGSSVAQHIERLTAPLAPATKRGPAPVSPNAEFEEMLADQRKALS